MRYAQDYLSPQQKVMSGAFAIGAHVAFLLLLIFGVTWQKKIEPQVNIVDLHASLPAPARPAEPPRPVVKPEPRVEPRPEPKPVVPKPEPKAVVPPPKPAAKPAPRPEVAKPDIALKEKAEKERRALEEKQKEAKKRADEAKAVAARQQQAQAAEAQRAKEQEEAQRKVAEQAAAARKSEIDKYRKAIHDKIRARTIVPQNIQGNPEAEFDVYVLPDGNVLRTVLKRSSGNAAYDRAVELAIVKAQPLPLPPDASLFKEFRELNLKFRPQE